MAHLSPEQKELLDSTLAKYVAAVNALDEGRFMVCFRRNCVVRDPYGVSLYEGKDGLRQLFATIKGTWTSYELRPGKVFYGGHERIVCVWEASGTARNGKTASFDGILVMTLEGELIDGLEVYWDASAMFEQIKD